MTKFQEFWAKIIQSTPGFGQFDDPKVTMTIGTIRRLMYRSHKDGFRCGIQLSKSLEKLGKTSDNFKDIMDILKDNQ